MEWIFVIFLGILSIQDIRSGYIDIRIVGICGGIRMIQLFIICMEGTQIDIRLLVTGIAVGILLLLFAYITQEKIGYGDGWVFCVIGVYLGGLQTILLLYHSVLLVGVITCLYSLRYQKSRKTWPFMPFVMAAYLLRCLIYQKGGIVCG